MIYLFLVLKLYIEYHVHSYPYQLILNSASILTLHPHSWSSFLEDSLLLTAHIDYYHIQYTTTYRVLPCLSYILLIDYSKLNHHPTRLIDLRYVSQVDFHIPYSSLVLLVVLHASQNQNHFIFVYLFKFNIIMYSKIL